MKILNDGLDIGFIVFLLVGSGIICGTVISGVSFFIEMDFVESQWWQIYQLIGACLLFIFTCLVSVGHLKTSYEKGNKLNA